MTEEFEVKKMIMNKDESVLERTNLSRKYRVLVWDRNIASLLLLASIPGMSLLLLGDLEEKFLASVVTLFLLTIVLVSSFVCFFACLILITSLVKKMKGVEGQLFDLEGESKSFVFGEWIRAGSLWLKIMIAVSLCSLFILQIALQLI
ncbi:MAG: hypothetical protein KBC35_02825 [Candidatus Pacebacteria bacterium]|jgi:hypothetical protein|nr:hypothetical protein [Candidatus Paceibacterota bacterium]